MTDTRKPIVVVGSINMDLVAHTHAIPVPGQTVIGTDFDTTPGGKGANQAVAAARLGYPVKMIGRVGTDVYGEQLQSRLRTDGVAIDAIQTTKGSSGIALILVSSSGENCIVVTPGVNALVSPNDIQANIATIREAGMVLTQLEIPIETVLCVAELCSREGIPLVLDPAPAVSLPPELLRYVTWFTPNETEAAFFLEELAANANDRTSSQTALALRHAGVQGVVLKLGSNGVFVSGNGVEEHVPPFPVTAVDTTAAGDTFNGAFATAMLMGKTAVESARFAAAAAAISVTRAGAQPSMPTIAEVKYLLETGHRPKAQA
jgi:ribokinase